MSRFVTVLAAACAVHATACGAGNGAGQEKKGMAMNGAFTPSGVVTSGALAQASAVVCVAITGGDTPFGPVPAGGFPSLYERTFELTSCKPIHGKATVPPKATLTGYTLLSDKQRARDPRDATLGFDTQRIFDSPLPPSFPVLLVIGGPPVTAPRGAQAKVPTVTSVAEPVRALALIGADTALDPAIRHLVGWQATRTAAQVRDALAAGHPLVALDAMRVAADDKLDDGLVDAATDLLHPSQPSAVRVEAIGILGAAIAGSEPGTARTERLIEAALLGWENEQRARIDIAYGRAMTSGGRQLRSSKLRARAQAMASAPNADELAAALRDLAANLK